MPEGKEGKGEGLETMDGWLVRHRGSQSLTRAATLGMIVLSQPGVEAFHVGHGCAMLKGGLGSRGMVLLAGSSARQRGGGAFSCSAKLEGGGKDPQRKNGEPIQIPPSLLDESRKVEEGLLPGEGPFPSLPPELADKKARKAATIKKEMFKDLWMRNVANNAAAAGHRTSAIMSGGATWASSTLTMIRSRLKFGDGVLSPDHYEEVWPPFLAVFLGICTPGSRQI